MTILQSWVNIKVLELLGEKESIIWTGSNYNGMPSICLEKGILNQMISRQHFPCHSSAAVYINVYITLTYKEFRPIWVIAVSSSRFR